jgi:general secretion pathway protein C
VQIGGLSVRWAALMSGYDGAALNRRAALAATAVSVVAMGYQLGRFVAVITGTVGADMQAPPLTVVTAPVATPPAGLDVLAGTHLFGEVQQEPASPAPPVDVPDTTLSLTLTGILFGEKDSDGQAIVAGGGRSERTYRIGQEIADTQGATVYAVLADRVTLRRGGAFETLRLPRDSRPTHPARQGDARAGETRAEPVATTTEVEARTPRNSAVRLIRNVRDGAFVGFGVLPGKDRNAFQALGLAPNDVVTQVNGVALDEPAKESVLTDALGRSGSVSLKILRGGVDQALTVNVNSPGVGVRQP